MNPLLEEKLQQLRTWLRATGGCTVAFSGGVDSSLLLAAAQEVLGERCLAVIGISPTYPQREFDQAKTWLDQQGIAYEVIHTEELTDANFLNNPPDRCYYCKRILFSHILDLAKARGFSTVVEGSNRDDRQDFRPGRRAVQELAIHSPLDAVGLGKNEIRQLAKELFHLPMAAKPSSACLSSRFQYGTVITPERLQQIETMENWLLAEGFKIVRARYHGELVRLELGPEEQNRMQQDSLLRQKCVQTAKSLGFKYISLDLEGFRSGSANEVLKTEVSQAH